MSAKSVLQPGRSNGTDQPGVDYRALFGALPGLYAVVLPDDPHFTIVAANDAWLQAIGKSREETISGSLFEVVPKGPDPAQAITLENLRASFRRVLVARQPDTMPVQRYDLPRAESEGGGLEELYWSPINLPVLGPDGAVSYIIHRVEDVTERRRVEEALRASQQESEQLKAERDRRLGAFDMVLARLQEFVYLYDREGRFLYVNKPLLDLWGLTMEQAIGKDFAEFGYQDELVRLHHQQIRRVVETGQPVNGENSYTSPAGITGHYEYTFAPIFAADGSVDSVVGHTRDVTENRRAEAALRASEAKYRTLFESIDEGFCIIELLFDADGTAHDYRFLEANSVFEEQSGLTGAMGKTMRELVPNIEPSWAELYGQVALTGEPKRFDANVESMDRWFDIYAFRIAELQERQVAVLFKDVTERRHSEEQLRKATDRLEAAHAAAELGMWTWDVQADHLIADGNLAFLFGIDARVAAEGSPAEPYIQRVHPEDQPLLREKLSEALAKGGTYAAEHRVSGADGRERWVAWRGRAKLDAQGRPQMLHGVVLDVTERRQAEESLRKSEERLGFALEAGDGVGTWDWDVSADRIYSNARFAKLYSVDPARAAAGAPLSEFVASIHPDDRAIVGEAIQRAVETGLEFTAEYRLVQQDGSVRWVYARGRCSRDAAGTPTRFPGIIFDVTERKRVEQELQRKIEELDLANRGLEEFSHVASHDLQEPLRMVNIYAQLLIRRLGSNATDEQREFAGFIQGGVRRMDKLIKDLLSYSRTIHTVGEIAVSQASLDDALHQALLVMDTRVAETGATITYDSLPTVRGDTMQLTHLFQNLLSNAFKYRSSDRPPKVHITAVRQECEWIISVHDNGIGFEPNQAQRIFGLFKRLHREDEYPGTGLGLAICKRIVERFGGRIWAESEPGVGSTFFFSLSAVQS